MASKGPEAAGPGCRLDDAGNVVVPFRDGDGYLQGVRLMDQAGKALDIGNVGGRGIRHVVGKLSPDTKTVFVTSDYRLAVLSGQADIPVVVVAAPEAVPAMIKHLRQAHPTHDVTKLDGANKPAVAHWRAVKQWAPIRTNGPQMAGPGCRLDDAGNVVIPFRDANGNLHGVRLVDPKGKARDIGDVGGDGIRHVVGKLSPDSKAAFVTSDYRQAVLFREADIPVVVVTKPEAVPAMIDHLRRAHPTLDVTEINDANKPAVAHWRTAEKWAPIKTSGPQVAGPGCRLDDAGNLVIPYRDDDGDLRGVRLVDPKGKALDIGDVGGRGVCHVIGKLPEDAQAAFVTADYKMAVKFHRRTGTSVIVVSKPEAVQAMAEHLHQTRPKFAVTVLEPPTVRPLPPKRPILDLS